MTVALRSIPQALFFKIKNEEKKSFADWLIELANRGFGMSTDAFLMYRSNRSFNMHTPGILRAFDTFSVPGRREFDDQSLPGGGEFDPHALGVGN